MPIIKYLDHLKSKIQQLIQDNYINGISSCPNDYIDATEKLNDNLNGTIEFLTRNRREIENYIRTESVFISNINGIFGIFRLKFIPMIQKKEIP